MQNSALAKGDEKGGSPTKQMTRLKTQVSGHIDRFMSLNYMQSWDIEEAVNMVKESI